MQHSKTVIKIFDVSAKDTPIAILRGHIDLIYDMHWSSDDKYLVSASSDGSCKVWDVQNISNDSFYDRLDYTENDKRFFRN